METGSLRFSLFTLPIIVGIVPQAMGEESSWHLVLGFIQPQGLLQSKAKYFSPLEPHPWSGLSLIKWK